MVPFVVVFLSLIMHYPRAAAQANELQPLFIMSSNDNPNNSSPPSQQETKKAPHSLWKTCIHKVEIANLRLQGAVNRGLNVVMAGKYSGRPADYVERFVKMAQDVETTWPSVSRQWAIRLLQEHGLTGGIAHITTTSVDDQFNFFRTRHFASHEKAEIVEYLLHDEGRYMHVARHHFGALLASSSSSSSTLPPEQTPLLSQEGRGREQLNSDNNHTSTVYQSTNGEGRLT